MNKISAGSKKRFIILGLAGIVLLGAVLYSNILHAPFVFDDHSSIKQNDSIASVSESLKSIHNNRYITLFTFALNYAIDGLNPFGYHLINNLIHVINALLVYYLVTLTFRTPYFSEIIYTPEKSSHPPFGKGGRGGINLVAFASAFIFIAHPIQTQAVTYIVQRATSMATMFYLLSLVMYIKFRIQQSELHATRYTLYAISLVSAILAMKTKEIAFTLPFIVVLYEFMFFSGSPLCHPEPEAKDLRDSSASPQNDRTISRITHYTSRIFFLLPIILTMLIIPLSMLNIRGSMETITQDIDIYSRETANISRTDYLLTQFRVIVTYLRLLVLPINQNFDYSYPVYLSFFNPQVFLSFLCLSLIFCLGIYFFRNSRFSTRDARSSTPNSRLIAFGIFWFFITLSVESSFIPIRDVIVEHRLYLPSIGFFIAAVLSAEYLFSNMRLKTALMAAIVLALSVGTYSRNTIWKDPQLLWEDVIAKAPNNARAYNNLGVELKNKGEYGKAIEHFEKSLKADKNYTAVYFNLGDVQYRLGNYEDAVVYLKKALTLKLNQQLHLDVLNKLGRTYSAMGQTESAIDAFKEAIKVYPTAVAPYNNLGVQYIKTGRFDLAIEIFESALKIREEQYLRSNLSLAYSKKEEIERNSEKKK